MPPQHTQQRSGLQTVRAWWAAVIAREGLATACRKFAAAVWEFAIDSTPQKKRSRYGDVDYDWDHRVNTTSGGLPWRERLLGTLYSPYQPTDPDSFHFMIADWQRRTGANAAEFAFCDLGSGKGRTLLMASDYPFRRIIGVELLESLHTIAQENISNYRSDAKKCFALEAVCADAIDYPLPEGPLLLYLFNPFPEAGLRQVLSNLDARTRQGGAAYVLYHNPVLEPVLAASSSLLRIAGTHQYSIYAVNPRP